MYYKCRYGKEPQNAILSVFFGITVFINTRGEHNPPHIHARYGEYDAAFDIAAGDQMGDFPRRQARLIQAWIEIHREDLMINWELARTTGECCRIAPLC